jgi:hypothetical protein
MVFQQCLKVRDGVGFIVDEDGAKVLFHGASKILIFFGWMDSKTMNSRFLSKFAEIFLNGGGVQVLWDYHSNVWQ